MENLDFLFSICQQNLDQHWNETAETGRGETGWSHRGREDRRDRVDIPDGATLSKSWSRWMKKTERAAGARTRTSRLHAAQECQLPFGRVPRWTTVFLARLSAFCILATDRKTDWPIVQLFSSCFLFFLYFSFLTL